MYSKYFHIPEETKGKLIQATRTYMAGFLTGFLVRAKGTILNILRYIGVFLLAIAFPFVCLGRFIGRSFAALAAGIKSLLEKLQLSEKSASVTVDGPEEIASDLPAKRPNLIKRTWNAFKNAKKAVDEFLTGGSGRKVLKIISIIVPIVHMATWAGTTAYLGIKGDADMKKAHGLNKLLQLPLGSWKFNFIMLTIGLYQFYRGWRNEEKELFQCEIFDQTPDNQRPAIDTTEEPDLEAQFREPPVAWRITFGPVPLQNHRAAKFTFRGTLSEMNVEQIAAMAQKHYEAQGA
ncbi:hypothetical protein ABW19_dt0202610 [Dactylella cylindrospora]|nr:hypothetical protein ABW19_dt0202610 [Dactylella cylindrospora]